MPKQPKCPDRQSDHRQPGHPLRSLGNKPASKLSPRSGQLSRTHRPACDPRSYPRFDSLIQVHLLGFESPWGGPLPPLQRGEPRPGCDGVYASYLSVTDRLSVKRPNSLGRPRRQLLCTHRSIGCKLESNYTVA